MKIERLNEMWAEDCGINPHDLTNETVRSPKLHAKYYALLVNEGLILDKLKSDYVELEHAKSEYYRGDMSQEELKRRQWAPFQKTILKNDLDKYIQADKDIIKLSLRISLQKRTVEYLEEIIRSINRRSFEIKNAIEWSRFTSGG
jgi:hypothetical protein